MSDIVERLRRRGRELTQVGDGTLQGLVLQAAAEIERLRKINTKLQRDLSDRISDIFEHDAEIERLRAALKRIRNENQVSYIQIGDDPNENGPTIQTDGPFAKIASATLKQGEVTNEEGLVDR